MNNDTDENDPRFDVFLSHNSKDKPAVIELAKALKARGIEVWLDVWQLRPGKRWQKELEEAIRTAPTVAVLVSKDGLGPWQDAETDAALRRSVNDKTPIIPVLLPGATDKPKLPLFLEGYTWVNLRDGFDGEGLDRLIWGITGVKPDSIDADTETTGARPGSVRVWFSEQWPVTDPELFGRENELGLLDKAWHEGKLNILALVAAGGVGKTALVNRWANYNMRPDAWRGAARVYAWSFYSQGSAEGRHSSTDAFLDKALRWFGGAETADTPLAAYDKGTRLAELVREHKTLLLLDGAEPLQEPPGVAAEHPGQVKDPGLKGLLRGLAHTNPGLCIVSTRVPIADLKPYTAEGGTAFSKDLEDLAPETGAKYLKSLGIDGPPAELERASKEFANHALALTLLGRFLVKHRRGDIRKRDEIPDLLHGKEQGRQAKRVMAWYAKAFEHTPEGELLHILGLFDRPAEPGAIAALREGEPIDSLTERLHTLSDEDWVEALDTLHGLRLIAAADAADALLDCHPLVREYFGERLSAERPDTWKAAHDRLYEYYKALQDKDLPDTVEEMAPLFQALTHACHAGRHQEALEEIYRRRIQRGSEFYSTKKLGVFGADLSALAGFFEPPWKRPVDALTEAAQAFVLNSAAFRLRALGHLAEAVEPMKAGLEAHVALKDWKNAAQVAENLSELLLTLGRVAQAVDYAEQSVRYADDSGEWKHRVAQRTAFGDALHQAGRLAEATGAFRDAEAMLDEMQPKHSLLYDPMLDEMQPKHSLLYDPKLDGMPIECPLLYSVGAFQHCDLILARGDAADAQRRGRTALDIVLLGSRNLLEIALDHLTLGRAGLALAIEAGTGDFAEAEKELDAAVDGLRKAGTQHELPRGLLARAGLYRHRGNYAHARQDLEEAWEIATRGGMRLHQCDTHIECARLLIAAATEPPAEPFDLSTLPPDSPFAQYPTAPAHIKAAQALIQDTGYHRRDPELYELSQ